MTEIDLPLSDGRTLHVYDTGAGATADTDLAVFWHHGTPNTGAPPEPLFAAAEARGMRWVSLDRPGYGGSTPVPDRDVASVAADVGAAADALGIGRFAVLGHSGGGPHALACAALLPDRVLAAVAVSGLAPAHAEGLDWFAGMGEAGAEELRAATVGRAALERYLATADFDPDLFTPADHAALAGSWEWLGRIAGQAVEAGTGGTVDDELAFVGPWGFEPEQVGAPVLVMHGGEDRMVPSSHGEWLGRHCPSVELRLHPADGHVSVLRHTEAALDWLTQHARRP